MTNRIEILKDIQRKKSRSISSNKKGNSIIRVYAKENPLLTSIIIDG